MQRNFREIRAFREIFPQKVEKKGPEVSTFGVFSPRYSQKYILNGNVYLRIERVRDFFVGNQGTFLDFQKKSRADLATSSLVAPLSLSFNLLLASIVFFEILSLQRERGCLLKYFSLTAFRIFSI